MNKLISDRPFGWMSSLEVDILGLTNTVESSKGEPVMSDEDVKLALVETMMIAQKQMEINKILIQKIQELEKSTVKNPFKK